MGTATLIQCAHHLCRFAPRLAISFAQLQGCFYAREKCGGLVRAGFYVNIRDGVAYRFPLHICALWGVAIPSAGDEPMRVRREVATGLCAELDAALVIESEMRKPFAIGERMNATVIDGCAPERR